MQFVTNIPLTMAKGSSRNLRFTSASCAKYYMTVTMFKDAFIGLYHFTVGHAVFVAPRRRVPMREAVAGPLDLEAATR